MSKELIYRDILPLKFFERLDELYPMDGYCGDDIREVYVQESFYNIAVSLLKIFKNKSSLNAIGVHLNAALDTAISELKNEVE